MEDAYIVPTRVPESLGPENAQAVEITKLDLIQAPRCEADSRQFTLLSLGVLTCKSGSKSRISGVGSVDARASSTCVCLVLL